MRAVPIVLAALSLAAASPTLAAVECAPKPDNPIGYQVSAVHADQVQPPATTPPIAVLDSGVAPVPELSGRLREGIDVTTGGHDATDHDGHGTAVATVAAGQAGGVRGVSPTSPIIPIKIFDDSGQSSADWVIQGIEKAIDLNAGVINISAAGDVSGTDAATNRAVEDAIDAAVTAGMLVVAPSGNEGAPQLDVPARYPHVIAVGATDQSNDIAPFSNTGAGLDLVAPGASIYTAAPAALCASGYALVNGTSFSAPAVAGAAALLLQKYPNLDATQLTDMLRLHGPRSPAPAWNPDTGFGLLDVPALLAAPVPPPDMPEVDDTITWAQLHPVVFAAPKHSKAISAHVAIHSDPADTFRVSLKKGDRFSATLKAQAGSLGLSISNGKRVLARKNPLRIRIKSAGIYYITVGVKTTPPTGTDYSLKLRR